MKKKKSIMIKSIGIVIVGLLLIVAGAIIWWYDKTIQEAIQEHHFTITKEECRNETEVSDWIEIDNHDYIPLEFFYVDKEDIDSFQVRPYYFEGWDYLDELCYKLINYSFEDYIFTTVCDDFSYIDKRDEHLKEDYVGCLRCIYTEKIREGIFEEKTRTFKGIFFTVPEFDENKVQVHCLGFEYCEIRNDNRYWSVKVRITQKPKKVCENIEVGEIRYVDYAYCHGCQENPNKCKENCYKDGCSFKVWQEEEMHSCINDIIQCQKECEEDLCNFDCETIIHTISKKDLTIDWLYDNCICNIFSNNLPTSFTNEEAMKYCSKYKCGDYNVETWNQIK